MANTLTNTAPFDTNAALPEPGPKQAILDVAQRLIAQHGYAGFSMRELSEQSGLAKGTIYYHFQDKRDIYLSTMQRDMERVEARLHAAVLQGDDIVEKLRLLIGCHLQLADERRSMILALLREIGNMSEEMRALSMQNNARMMAPAISLIRQGIAQGIFRPVDPEMATMSLFGTIHTYITWHMILSDQPLDPNMPDKILSFILHGLQAPGGTLNEDRRARAIHTLKSNSFSPELLTNGATE